MKKFLWLILPFLVACGGTVVEGDPNGFAPGHPPGMGPLTPGYFNQTPLFMTKWFVIMGFALAIIIVWWLTSKRVFEAHFHRADAIYGKSYAMRRETRLPLVVWFWLNKPSRAGREIVCDIWFDGDSGEQSSVYFDSHGILRERVSK